MTYSHQAISVRRQRLTLFLSNSAKTLVFGILPCSRAVGCLVLTGPTREQANVPFRLYTIQPRVGGTLTPLAILEDVEDEDGSRAKAEAVLPLDGAGQRVLVLFDGLKNGGPREYVLQ